MNDKPTDRRSDKIERKKKRSPAPDRPGPSTSGASLPTQPGGESPRSTAGATGSRPDRDMSLPVSIPITHATDGTFEVADPRRRVSVGRTDTDTVPVDLDRRISLIVEAALARALPAALGVPALQPGSPAPAPTLQSGQPVHSPALQSGQEGQLQRLVYSPARTAQDPAVGVPPRDEGTVATSSGRTPLPLAGSPDRRSRRRDRAGPHDRRDRRTVTVGRPTHSTTTSNVTLTDTGADDAPVPAVGHALHAARRTTSTTSTVTSDSRPQRLHLPPPPPRGVWWKRGPSTGR